MADPEDHPPTNPFSPGEAWRRVQEIGAQLTGAASSMAEDFANSPGGQFAEPIARMGARTAELATMWVAPMRAMLEEQQDLGDAIASWAEQQRVLCPPLLGAGSAASRDDQAGDGNGLADARPCRPARRTGHGQEPRDREAELTAIAPPRPPTLCRSFGSIDGNMSVEYQSTQLNRSGSRGVRSRRARRCRPRRG